LIAQVLTVGIAYFNDPALVEYPCLARARVWWIVIYLTDMVVDRPSPAESDISPQSTRAAGTPIFSIHLKSPLHLEVFHPLIGFTLLSVSSSLVHRTGHSLLPTIPETDPS